MDKLVKPKKASRKGMIIIALILLVILVGLAAGAYWQRARLKQALGIKTVQSNTPMVEADDKPQTEAKERAKQEQQAQKNANPGSAINPQITSINQDATNVTVRAIVPNATSGTCSLKLQKAGQSDITRSAPLGLVTSYYACQGFNLPKSEIPVSGQWKVVVQFENSQGGGKSEDVIDVSK